MKFNFTLLSRKPILDASPSHLRMASCYLDDGGMYHLFADFIDERLQTKSSWQAEVRYYRSPNLHDWQFVSTILASEPSLYQNFGVASPHVMWWNSKVYIFYAARQYIGESATMIPHAMPGQEGYLACRICCVSADASEDGAPVSDFVQHGVVLDNTSTWNCMRVDDPCAIVLNNKVRLYFKGFDDNSDLGHVQVGVCETQFDSLQFTSPSEPLFGVSGGGEMPRVFRHASKWHMFYHHFSQEQSSAWQHWMCDDGVNWEMNDPNLFCGAGSTPGLGAVDMSPVYSCGGTLAQPHHAIACGLEGNVLKLWVYELEVT